MSFSIIAAVAKNGIIGKDNKLPWYIPEDLEYFYKTIKGKPLIMGRKTHKSIGKVIAGSKNYVLSHCQSIKLPGGVIITTFSELLTKYKYSREEAMVIGGATVYEQFLPHVSTIYLTLINQEVDGDVYFPRWQREKWLVADKRDSSFGIYTYSFMKLIAKSSSSHASSGNQEY